ncbi:hypothetical protein WEI85_38425 [Actinomycetes bacterium KLBMP 9797]
MQEPAGRARAALGRRPGPARSGRQPDRASQIRAAWWPVDGVPDNPRSWLIRIGYRKLVDLLRSEQARRRREQQAAVADLVMHEPATQRKCP